MTGQSKVPEIEAKEKKQARALYVAAGILAAAIGMEVPARAPLVLASKNGDAVATAKTLGLMSTCAAAIELLLNPILGRLSDKYGRKPFMIMSTSLIAAVHSLVAAFPGRLDFNFLDRCISGAMIFCFINPLQAALADMFASKSMEKMEVTGAQIGTAFGIGFALGPLIGAKLAGKNAFAVSALTFVAIACWIGNQLSETLCTDKRKTFDLFASNPLSFVKLFKNDMMAKIASTIALESFAEYHNVCDLNFLYLKTVLGYGQQGVGAFSTGMGITQIFGGVLAKRTITSLGQRAYITIGNLGYIIGFGVMGSAKSAQHLALSLFFCMFGHQRTLEAGSLLAAHGAAAGMGHGELQGASANFLAVLKLVSPLLYTRVFLWAMSGGRNMPGLPYFLVCCFVAAAHLLFSTVPKEVPNKQE